MKRLLLILAAVSLLFACKKGGDDNIKYDVVTIGAEVAGSNITLSGKLGPDIDEAEVTSVGFFVSENKAVPESGSKDFAATLQSKFEKKITVADLDGKSATTFYYRAYAKGADKTYLGKVKAFATEKVAVSKVEVTPAVLGLEIGGKPVTLTAKVTPSNASYPGVTWITSDKRIAAVSDKGEVTPVSKGKCVITAIADGIKGTCNVSVRGKCPEGAVDMGTSVFWSKLNLGASEVYEEGDYFSWGETSSRGEFTEEKYSKVGNNYKEGENLKPEHDAARKILGGEWRIPTKEEFEELFAACDISLRQTGIYDGGRNLEVLTFKSKNTGNTIEIKTSYGCSFAPYNGWLYGYACYWTATKGKDAIYCAQVRSGNYKVSESLLVNNIGYTKFLPWYGMPIRPVTD